MSFGDSISDISISIFSVFVFQYRCLRAVLEEIIIHYFVNSDYIFGIGLSILWSLYYWPIDCGQISCILILKVASFEKLNYVEIEPTLLDCVRWPIYNFYKIIIFLLKTRHCTIKQSFNRQLSPTEKLHKKQYVNVILVDCAFTTHWSMMLRWCNFRRVTTAALFINSTRQAISKTITDITQW